MKFINKASLLLCTSIFLLVSCNSITSNLSNSESSVTSIIETNTLDSSITSSESSISSIIEETSTISDESSILSKEQDSSASSSSSVIESSSSSSSSNNIVGGLEGDPILTNEVAKQYYKNISTTSSGQDLIVELYKLIHPRKCSTSYSAIWDYLPYCDADPNNPSSDNIVAFYRGTTGKKASMNKEHVWPKSRGGHAIDGDPHMVRPTFTSDNSGRGNDFYNESPTSYDPNEFGAAQYRGISARIIFYCAVQEYQKLTLVDKTNDQWTSTTSGTMGKLSTLLKWNLEYPIDETEILRNEVLSGARTVKGKSFSFNRNPFIDDRSLACRIWGNTNSETLQVGSGHM